MRKPFARLVDLTLPHKEISDDTGFCRRTIEKWTAVLSRTGYIHTKRIGNRGAVFFIHKAKSKTKNPKPKAQQVPANWRTHKQQVPADEGRGPRPLEYTQADKSVDFQNDAPITNTLTPKNLPYYNTTAAAKDAAVSLPSFQELAKAKSAPRSLSPEELDERRRLLLRQSEELKRKYPAKGDSLGEAATA